MNPDTTRASLLLRMRDPDDHRAWHDFDAAYGELIVRYCRARGLQLSDAEDVRQLVMLSLSKSMPRFEYRPEIGRFRDYLRRTVRNAITRYMQRHNNDEIGIDTIALESMSVGDDAMDAEWDRQWTQLHCRTALRSLRRESDPRHVDVFERLLNGDSIQCAAESFGMSPESVRKIKQRAKQRLQALIARQLRQEDGLD
ncbi:MAG: sigma-70 family RNA polymerase sigma factor [Phycisphaerales bacterium]|nr:sigma-70 family RNA polymerase sigma factor [Phycisphaerales bacterium]MCB9862183.1 sigma-70 family RNA polymerase sigma factor [Phycisphaerales bacterium]